MNVTSILRNDIQYPNWGCLVVFVVIAFVFYGCFKLSRHYSASRSATPQEMQQSFGSPDNAYAIHQYANTDYFQYLLAAFEAALKQEGYELTRSAEHRVTLVRSAWERVARAIFIERDKYMAPMQDANAVSLKADMSGEDGFSDRWLWLLINGSASQGWYITQRSGWEAHAYPLRQVQITARVKTTVLTRDVVGCLSDLARAVRSQPFPDKHIGSHITKVISDGFEYDFTRMLCETSPGWFPDAAGTEVPADIIAGQFPPVSSSPYRHFIVRAQGTCNTTSQTLAKYIDRAGKRIAAGEVCGAEYDDDSGYAFIVTKPATEH